jgi:hypothetical protein
MKLDGSDPIPEGEGVYDLPTRKPEDLEKAAELKNLEVLTRDSLRDAYRGLAAEFYCVERNHRDSGPRLGN